MKKNEIQELVENTKKLNILYAEDDNFTREAVGEFLKTIFLNVDICEDGENAFKKFQQNSYDIIIVDLIMPKKSGMELIENIRNINTDVSILILSAFSDNNSFLQSINYGVDGYLLKPMVINQFYTTLQKVIKKIQTEQKLAQYQLRLEQKVAQKTKELEHRCFHEHYTDLPNSILLLEDLATKQYSHMLLLDMSHFAMINKEYGKVFANHVIIRTARILEHHIHQKAKLFKTESDRFVILLKDATDSSIDIYADQIISFFDNKNVKIDDAELHVTFNIGIATVKDDPSETIINCEYALDKSKTVGSRHYEIFNENTEYFSNEKSAIKRLKDTRVLVLQEKIIAYFQPIQDIETNSIEKYEVLARGKLNNEIILPQDFISSAEKLGLISSITKTIINQSFEFFQDKNHSFSINLAERDLLDGYLINFLIEKIKFYKIDPSRVTFEILENITISDDSKKITKELNSIKALGFKLAIDDFGIENSNFSRMLDIDLDIIKIDGMFIKDISSNPKNKMVAKAIVNLAKTMGIKTVAEYVEDQSVYDMVKECGVDYAQGFYIGKPKKHLIDR
jgi:diguanylate cyclase (GGDEF)-like protein